MSSRKPDISMAPQKDTSPSPCHHRSSILEDAQPFAFAANVSLSHCLASRLWDPAVQGAHLAEVHVAHAELGALHEHREVHLAAAAQVLDVAVAAVLAPGRCRAPSLARAELQRTSWCVCRWRLMCMQRLMHPSQGMRDGCMCRISCFSLLGTHAHAHACKVLFIRTRF